MTVASDNAFPSLLITEGTEPSAPAAGKQRIYIDSTSHHLSATNSSGTERDLESASGGMASDALWDAAGDLAVGSGANTAAKLVIGAANGMVLMVVSGDLPAVGERIVCAQWEFEVTELEGRRVDKVLARVIAPQG